MLTRLLNFMLFYLPHYFLWPFELRWVNLATMKLAGVVQEFLEI